MRAPQAIAVGALRDALGVRVSTQRPASPPDEFVIVSRIGGGSDDWATRDPRFLIECYSRSELSAELLAERAWEAWRNARRHAPEVNWSHADNNLVRFSDPDPSHSRFQFTGGLQLRLTT